MMNSASRKETQLNRYRVMIFVKSIMDLPTHKLVFDYLTTIFQKAGYWTLPRANKDATLKYIIDKLDLSPKLSGIDASKGDHSSLFYLPCKIIGQEEYAFFWTFGCKQDEIARYALDVEKITQTHVVKPIMPEKQYTYTPKYETTLNNGEYSQRILDKIKVIESLVAELRPGNRNTPSISIGGHLKTMPVELKEKYLAQMQAAGVDKSTMKTARKYAYAL